MAIDEALLHAAATDQLATLRFYAWSEPTLSLGYFQKIADRHTHTASVHAPCVRRQSGGGAILHDHEVTYSLTLPASHPLAREAESLYNAVHSAIIAVLRNLVPSGFPPERIQSYCNNRPISDAKEPFLCFQRRSPGDIIVADTGGERSLSPKIVGSAQRRSRGAVLQHGSILLARSERAPELAGVSDLCDNIPDAALFVSDLSKQILNAVGLEVTHRSIPNQVFDAASNLRVDRYRNPLWTQRR